MAWLIETLIFTVPNLGEGPETPTHHRNYRRTIIVQTFRAPPPPHIATLAEGLNRH